MQNRVSNVITDCGPSIANGLMTAEDAVKRTILTENFESYASSGGGFLDMSNFIYRGTYGGGALDQQIGGCGLYRVGFDYVGGKWKFLDQGITNMYRIWRERRQAE